MVQSPRGPSAPDQPLEIAVLAGNTVKIYPVEEGARLTFGRDPDNAVQLEDEAASRHHAVFHAGPPARFEDLGSRNGIQVSEPEAPTPTRPTRELRQLRSSSVEVTTGDRVVIGSTTILIRRAPAAPPAEGDSPIVRDPAMLRLYEKAFRLAETPISILLLGEPGVGKDVLARAIHQRSPRAKHPFQAADLSTLQETLLEAELFGYEKGAFTGAHTARAGLFESADRGTVFLDELGNLSLNAQAKLLRVLENREVRRVGAKAAIRVDVRFISATNANLEELVAGGKFRRDLYDRVLGEPIVVPPLRERIADLEPLAERFIAGFSAQMGRSRVPTLSREALVLLERYDWPGNVRELRNAIDRAVALSSGEVLLGEHLPDKVQSYQKNAANAPGDSREPSPGDPSGPVAILPAWEHLDDARKAIMKQQLQEALAACNWNGTKAAQRLGISRRTLVNWMNQFPELSRGARKT